MTDKQIIIDGCDVSECELYREDNGVFAPDGTAERTELCYLTNDYCANNPNCYYKQLKRKEQSEEKLVKQIQTICDFINNRPETFKGVNGSVDKIITDYAERKEQECEELKKQNNQLDNGINEQFSKIVELEGRNNLLKVILTEIKEIAEKEVNNRMLFADKESFCDFNKILQKISEVEE